MFKARTSPAQWFRSLWPARQSSGDDVPNLDSMSPAQIRSLIRAAGMKAVDASKFAPELTLVDLATYAAKLQVATTKVWASWKACDLTANAAMTVPFKVVRGKSTDNVEVPGLATLLEYPNDTMTFADLVYLTVMHVKMVGNAFWLKAGQNLSGDRPTELYPINPRRVTILIDRVSGEVTGYRINGTKPFIVAPEDMIHFRRPSPVSDFYGMGDIEAGRSLIEDTANRAGWKEVFWKNGATPSGILVSKDGPSVPEEWEKMKAEFQSRYGGKGNAGKVAWLTGEWSHIKFGPTLAEMADIENRKLSTEEIFTLHGVPLSVAGIRDAANYATAEIDDARFRKYTVLPLIKMIEDTMNTDLVAGFGVGLEIEFQMSGLIAIGQVLSALTAGFDRGVLSINEMREAIGLKPDPENPLFTQHFITAALVPLDLAGVAASGQASNNAAKAIIDEAIREHAAKPGGGSSFALR